MFRYYDPSRGRTTALSHRYFYRHATPFGVGVCVGHHSSVSCASLHTVMHMKPLRGKSRVLMCSCAPLFILHSSFFTIRYSLQNRRFCCVRTEPRKPAKEEADVMQGGKERACELLLRPCSHTAYDCGLEGGGRRRCDGSWVVDRRNAIINKLIR